MYMPALVSCSSDTLSSFFSPFPLFFFLLLVSRIVLQLFFWLKAK